MKIKIYIDSNAWDILYEQKVNLDEELNEFDLCITEEVEIEMDKIPTENPKKRNIKEYFYKYIDSGLINICDVRCFAVGGLNTPPKIRPYTKGFGSVYDASKGSKFASCADSDKRKMIDSQMGKERKKRKTGLEDGQTDVFLAAESKKNFVLTAEKITPKKKKGWIREAKKNGWFIIDPEEKPDGITLVEYIKSEINKKLGGNVY